LDLGLDTDTAVKLARHHEKYGANSKLKNQEPKPLTKREKKILEVGLDIGALPPKAKDKAFMHSLMCQVGLPRKKVTGHEFERVCGNAGIRLKAGKLWD